MIDCFKGILMTHDLDIFESGKKLGLNGLIHKKQLTALLTFLWKVMHYITLLLSYFVYVYTAGKISIEHVTIFPSK